MFLKRILGFIKKKSQSDYLIVAMFYVGLLGIVPITYFSCKILSKTNIWMQAIPPAIYGIIYLVLVAYSFSKKLRKLKQQLTSDCLNVNALPVGKITKRHLITRN